MPLAPLEWSSATDDNKHMKKNLDVAVAKTESTDENIKQSLTVDNIDCRAVITSPCPHNIGVLLSEECTCGSFESNKGAFRSRHLNEASNNTCRWAAILSQCPAHQPSVQNIRGLVSEECTCGSFESKKRAFLTQHLNEAHNIRRWVVTLSPFVRLRSTQGSMTPCDLIFEHTAFCRRPNMQGG